MIQFSIPGINDSLQINYLLLDYNGTLAVDGKLLPLVKDLLNDISKKLKIHIVTADTFGMVREEMKGINCSIKIISAGREQQQKANYLQSLNAGETICIGNGQNDELMLKQAAIGILVIGHEGAAGLCFGTADIVCNNIIDALNLLLHPQRMIATLRR